MYMRTAVLALAISSACSNTKPDGATMSPSSDKANGTQPTPLTLELSARDGAAVLTLTNHSRTVLRVLSHVEASDVHLDWFKLTLTAPGGAPRTLRLSDARDESGRVIVDLAPEKSVEHVVDVQAWAARTPNSGQRFVPGSYQMIAEYAVGEGGNFWTGTLTAGPVSITLR